MYGTNVPKPQTGQLGVHYPLNGTDRNEGIEDGGFYANQASFTGLPLTDPPPLIGNVGGVGASNGPTTDPSLPPNTGWNPNPPTQYPIPNIHDVHRAPPNGGEFIAPALLPSADRIPYSQQPSPRLPYASSNYLHTYSFQTSNGTSFSLNATGLARQLQDGPPLRVEDWDAFRNTGLVPTQVNIMEERIICSPETTIHAGSVMSPRSETRLGVESRQLAPHGFVLPNPGDRVAASFPRSYSAAMHDVDSTSQQVLSPTSPHTGSQSSLDENGVAGTPYYNQFNRDHTVSELGSIGHTNMPLEYPPEKTNYDRRGSSSSARLQVSSQLSNRDEEIRQALLDSRSFCRCDDREREKKVLRHWEYHCPFNPLKKPALRCDLPNCKNRDGFLNSWNLRRHQETASYHNGKK